MIKKVLTYCILLNFIVLFSPRTIWHSHSDIVQTGDNQKDHKNLPSHQHDDCYLCTFSLQPALTPTALKVVFPHPDNYISPLIKIHSHTVEDKVFFSLRAPPIDVDLG